MTQNSRHPLVWVPSLYLAMGLPNVMVGVVAATVGVGSGGVVVGLGAGIVVGVDAGAGVGVGGGVGVDSAVVVVRPSAPAAAAGRPAPGIETSSTTPEMANHVFRRPM